VPEGVVTEDAGGALGLSLLVAPGTTLDAVNYVITGPGGFARSGNIDVSHSSTIAATLGGIPGGSGYSIALSATATDALTTCAGSASFDVVAGQTVTVTVSLDCHVPPGAGSATVNGVINTCPVIDGLNAVPAEVVIGNAVSLSASAHDSDAAPAALTYQWSATSGTFNDVASANPKFTCGQTGVATLTLKVSDGDPSASCADTMNVVVTCSPNEIVTHPYPGITLVRRTDLLASPPRQTKANVVFVDLDAPEVHFKMTPAGENLPPDLFGTAGWPTPYPAFEVVRRRTVDFLEEAHAQVAINGHFFAPFPVPSGSNQGDYAYLIGLAASRGNVYSAFESPFQNYAIVSDSPAINIDRENHARVVHRDPAFADGKHVLEDVNLYNALSGSAQIVTNGAKSVPEYNDATHPNGLLIGNATYSNSNSWYALTNSRSAIGLTQDERTLVLFTVDVRPTSGASRSQGMTVGEVADVLLGYGVWNALNLDGGGSTSLGLQDPADNVRKLINVSSDSTAGRVVASNLAVYSDGIDPVTAAVASPAPNANGWNNTAVSVVLEAGDARSGNAGALPGWVDQIQYALAGAQNAAAQAVSGPTASVNVTALGVTQLTYFATDAAGNEERPHALTLRLDADAPMIDGMPAPPCVLPANEALVQVAHVTATDGLSGLAEPLQVTATSGDASDMADIRVTPDGAGGFTLELRGKASSGGPRVYTISATATDRAGNTRAASATCAVAAQ